MNELVFKTLTLEELKADYSTTHGFVFKANTRSSIESIDNLCATLITKNITKEYPQFIVRLGVDDTTTVFVYANDFDAPTFLHKSNVVSQMTRAFTVQSLVEYFNN